MEPARSGLASALLLCLYQHRLMSTSQLSRLLTPEASTPRHVQRELARLRDDGLADAVTCGRAGHGAWFLTLAGAELAEQSCQVVTRPYRMDATRAAGPLRNHTLAVNDVGLAFASAARDRGDTCGTLDWIPEVAHRLAEGRHLISDALLSYIAENPAAGTRTQLQWFIELDRATMPVARLAAKLDAYAQYHALPARGSRPGAGPAWRRLYPRFPRLLVILAGENQDTLERRRHDLVAQVEARGVLDSRRMAAGVTTLTRLTECGPFARVFLALGTGTAGGPCSDALLIR